MSIVLLQILVALLGAITLAIIADESAPALFVGGSSLASGGDRSSARPFAARVDISALRCALFPDAENPAATAEQETVWLKSSDGQELIQLTCGYRKQLAAHLVRSLAGEFELVSYWYRALPESQVGGEIDRIRGILDLRARQRAQGQGVEVHLVAA